MGIHDRDYMRRRPEDDEGRKPVPTDSRLEEFFSGFLRRNPKFLLYVGIGLGVLILAAVAAAAFLK